MRAGGGPADGEAGHRRQDRAHGVCFRAQGQLSPAPGCVQCEQGGRRDAQELPGRRVGQVWHHGEQREPGVHGHGSQCWRGSGRREEDVVRAQPVGEDGLAGGSRWGGGDAGEQGGLVHEWGGCNM